ncbi:penicillin-binding protein activator [Flavisphingomonas formosensis]|uniref:penicillin-binding protein activator n=1 Tax=Flavisphingomonas formosensis TaxID=861534 RepID=UPI0012F94423|nr:penicillin-binding protein activator [Sphingomonas formosensis]
MAEQATRPQPRRSLLKFAGLAFALFLAGCGGMIPKGHGPGTQAPPPPKQTGPVGALPEDRERQRVALLVPLTGPNAAVGQSIANAANLAILDTGGRKVRITTYDTNAGAAAAAQRAVAEGNRLFLGPLLADDVRVVAPVARQSGVPVIAFSNDATVAGNGVYLMGFTPNQSIDRVVRYARSRGATRFAALAPTGLYGRSASTAMIRAVESSGGKMLALETYDRAPQSIKAATQKLTGEADFDALLIADGGRIAVQIVPLVRKGGDVAAHIMGTELWNAEPGLAAQPALNGAWFASVSDGLYRQLAAKYRARFGKAPYRLASLGYDAVLLTVRIAADWKIGDRFPAQRLTDADGFSGVDGAFRFGDNGIAERALEVRQIEPGGIVVASPAAKSFGQ